MKTPTPEWIENRVERVTEGGCWVWMGYLDPKGYARTDPVAYGELRVHRLSFRVFKGEIPKGQHVLHSCDNPACVNPAHLRLGDNTENVQDRERRGRGAYKPTPLEVDQQILSLLGTKRQYQIAHECGVSEAYVSTLKKRNSHV